MNEEDDDAWDEPDDSEEGPAELDELLAGGGSWDDETLDDDED